MQIRAPSVFVLVFLAASTTVQAQGVSDMLRSIAGSLKGVREEPRQQQSATTATMGIRGIDDEPGSHKQPAGRSSNDSNVRMEGWMASKSTATRVAEKKGLVAREAALRE